MKKCGKTALSLLLSVSMGVATVTPVMASPARGEPELNPLVAVIEKVNSGDTLNLTEEGTLDWVHITGKEINRKSGDEELIQWENLDADSALSTAGDSAMAYTYKSYERGIYDPQYYFQRGAWNVVFVYYEPTIWNGKQYYPCGDGN